MTDLNILSCSINGLHGPHKRTGVLDFLHRGKIDIVFVRESRLKEDVHKCNNTFYEVVSHSSSHTKTKGVLISVWRTLNITILYKGCDTDGRMTHIKTIVENRNIVFLSVYAPCTPDPSFYIGFVNLSPDILWILKLYQVQIWIL